ncbi:MAG: VOC family protein [Gemmatimonadaceae bacterium]|nr:VOC family protein [Acetobacteraceae bacterium]
MADPHGRFVWYELMTTDMDAAARFYAGVVGWTVSDFDGDASYRMFSAGPAGVGGLMAVPPGAGDMRPGWFGYVGVDDVNATVDSIVAAGGAVQMPARDLDGVGRIAMLADPQGVAFYVMRGTSSEPSVSFNLTAPGHGAWNELGTTDLPAALAFYAAQFGWTKGDAMSMGPMGDYQFVHHGGERIGAMMARPEPGPPPGWQFYFRVADIDAAARATTAGGGTILNGPMPVPGDDHILVATDPQGATFAVVGQRNA